MEVTIITLIFSRMDSANVAVFPVPNMTNTKEKLSKDNYY